MTIDFVCQECEGSFALELEELLEEEKIECPNCEARAGKKLAVGLGEALEELAERIAALDGKFQVALAIEPEDLPAKVKDDDEDDEDEDGDEDDEDDEASDEDAPDDRDDDR